MFNVKDILARLQDGDTVDAIAAEMTDALNAAQKEYEEQQKVDATVEAKREAMRDVLAAVAHYYDISGCEEDMLTQLANIAGNDQELDRLVKEIDQITELMNALLGLKNLEFMAPKVKKSKCQCGSSSCECKHEPLDADLVIRTFLQGI